MRIFIGILAAVVAMGTLGAGARPAAAQVVAYDNGAPNGVNGNEMTQWVQADDFLLPTATNITGVRFWAIDDLENGPGYQGSIVWTIYGNGGTNPGAILHRAAVVPTRIFDHATTFGSSYKYDFATGGLALAPGTYWLGLHNGPLTTDSHADTYWESTADNATIRGNEDIAPFDSGLWFNNENEHAFKLFTETGVVPEPGSLALLATGGMPLLGFLRRRRQS